EIPPFLPSELLNRRPDIIQAEEELKAANYSIGVAKANYFPSISLTGALGFESSTLSNLVQSSAKFWNVGALISGPILDFGRTKSNVKVAESRKRQAVINYVQTVKRAFSEVHEALLRLQSIKREIEIQEKLLKNYQEILQTTVNQYENGLVDYLNVISAKRNYERAQLKLVSLKKEYLQQEIMLYKALGGGWKRDILFSSNK
ncbi:TolC family protein, partial [Thermovibrio sp.]